MNRHGQHYTRQTDRRGRVREHIHTAEEAAATDVQIATASKRPWGMHPVGVHVIPQLDASAFK